MASAGTRVACHSARYERRVVDLDARSQKKRTRISFPKLCNCTDCFKKLGDY